MMSIAWSAFSIHTRSSAEGVAGAEDAAAAVLGDTVAALTGDAATGDGSRPLTIFQSFFSRRTNSTSPF